MSGHASWYHAHIDAVSRGDGKSAVGLAAYVTGQSLKDEETGRWCKRNHPGEVLGWGTIIPSDAPAYLADNDQLGRAWNDVQRSEKRKDSHLANHWNVAGAGVFSELDHIETAKTIAQRLTDRYGVMVTWAVHKPTDHGDDRNWHMHFAYNMRRVGADGFGEKAREIVAKVTRSDEARWQRQMFANVLNERLERIGSTERVSPLSYAERGIDREATEHLGDKQNQRELQGDKTPTGEWNRAVQRRNAQRVQLKEEHAQLTAKIYDLDQERERRQAMSATAQDRPANAYADLKLEDDERKQLNRRTDQLREAEQKDRQFGIREMLERAQKQKEEAEQDKIVRARADKMREDAGEPTSPRSRYAQALAENFSIKDPFTTLANADMAEYQMFRKGQNDLKAKIENETDPGKKKSLEMRYLIQHHEYVASILDRLAEDGRHIAGHDTADARKDNANASIHREKALALRGDREGMIREQEKQAKLEERNKIAEIVGRYTGAMPHNTTAKDRESYEAKTARLASEDHGKRDGLKVDQPTETGAKTSVERGIEKAVNEKREVMTRYGPVNVPREGPGGDGKTVGPSKAGNER